MSTARFPHALTLGLLALGMLWAAVAGVFIRTSGDPAFPTAETIDQDLSAQPGINLRRDQLAPGELEAVLVGLSQRGITWVRFTLPWDEIEPVRGQFDWDPWDEVMASFARWPALRPVVVLDRSPAWARGESDAGNPSAPPHERSDYGAYVAAIAGRYGRQLTYYQVWHEPNISPHWGSQPADPADYLGLLREAAVGLRAVDADAQIIAAALAPTTEEGGANLSDLTFLDQLYALGGRAWFDFPAIQPYGFSGRPDEPADAAKLNFGRAYEARQVMLRHGDAGTSLWATAFGWDASAGLASASRWGGVTSGEQTAYTQAAFAKAAQEWPWLGPMLWTPYFPPEPETEEVLTVAAASPSTLSPGSHRTDHPALHYSGGWRVTPSAADPSGDGDAITFTFRGTGVALAVQGGPYWAYLTVSIDGGPANQLPPDESGATYLVLHDPSSVRRLVPLAAGLPPGEHTARLVATGGWGQWALQGVVVSAAERSSTQLAWGLLGLALLVIAAASAGILPWIRRPHVAGSVGGDFDSPTGSHRLDVPVPGVLMWVSAIVLIVVFLASPWGVIDFAALLLLGFLFISRPGLAPPLVVASLPFWQRTEPFLRWHFGLFELLAWIGLLAWLARWFFWRLSSPATVHGVAPLGRPAAAGKWSLLIDITIVAVFLSGLVATIFASEQGVAWREFRIVFLFGMVLYLLITRTATRDQHGAVNSLIVGLLAGAVMASLIGLWQGVTGQGRVDVEGVGRIAALYGSPNNLALLLDRAVPVALALLLFDGWPSVKGSAAERSLWAVIMRSSLAAVLVITFAAAVATFSKGALLLGLPAALVFVLVGGSWRSGRRWPLWVLAGLAVIGAGGLVLLFRTPRFADLFNFESGTSFLRLRLWRGALNMALDHPFLGVGPDNFLYAYRSRYVLPSGWQELNLSHPHNILLDLWTRLGLLGVATGTAALTVSFAAGWRLFAVRSGFRGEHSRGGLGSSDAVLVSNRVILPGVLGVWPMALGLLGSLAATVAHGLIDNSLFLPDLMGWFVSASGIFWLYSVRREE